MRRLIGLSMLTFLVGCGGGGNDSARDAKSQAQDRLLGFYEAFGDGEAEKACSYLTSAAKKEMSPLTCEDRVTQTYAELGEADKESFDTIKVKSAEVTDTTGMVTLTIETADGDTNERDHKLVKQRGEWYVDDLGDTVGDNAVNGDQTLELEHDAEEELAARDYPNADVECPSDVSADKGSTFTCTIEGVPDIAQVTYKVIDEDGNVEIESVE